jgi:NAD(P)-dependent dehydrogenase (short-subunit alcohol dehydrogenase family)
MALPHPVLVTGGASGVGAATIKLLQANGHQVVSLDIKDTAIDGVTHIGCDLSDPAAIDAALAELPGPYSALLNIAGVPGTVGSDLTIQVNVLGLRRLTEGVMDRIADGGTIVNVASIAGNNWRKRRNFIVELLAKDDFADGLSWWQANAGEVGTDAYTFSKETVVVYTMQLAGQLLDRGITVNDVGPGPVETPILPDFTRDAGEEVMQQMIDMVGRAAQPTDIAEALVTLAERQINWLNGQHIVVDGGVTAGYSARWQR